MKSIAELIELKDKSYAKINMRDTAAAEKSVGGPYKSQVLLCGGTGCLSSNSEKLRDKLVSKLEEFGIKDDVQVIMTGCFGLCAEGPIVVVYPEGAMYSRVSLKDMDQIAEEHLLNGNVVEKLLIGSREAVTLEDGTVVTKADFFNGQKRVALRNCGRINPENIDEYIAFNGYQALAKVLTENTPEEVIQIIKDSGL